MQYEKIYGRTNTGSMVSVIFVEPESPGNVGSIARCMKNFGVGTLILVNPCSLTGAQKMAMHAKDILENAVIVDSFTDALAHVDVSVATTSKTAGIVRAAVAPHHLRTVPGDIGIVIGRESRGLTNEEIEQCDCVVSIPTSKEYPALNAASACCIILYELFQPETPVPPQPRMHRKTILKECEKIADIIEKRDHRKRIWRIVIKRALSTAFLTDRETTVLLGFFRRVRTVLEATLSQKC